MSRVEARARAVEDARRLGREGYVRVKRVTLLHQAFKDLKAPLLEAETGVGYTGYGLETYMEWWAQPKDVEAAEALYELTKNEVRDES